MLKIDAFCPIRQYCVLLVKYDNSLIGTTKLPQLPVRAAGRSEIRKLGRKRERVHPETFNTLTRPAVTQCVNPSAAPSFLELCLWQMKSPANGNPCPFLSDTICCMREIEGCIRTVFPFLKPSSAEVFTQCLIQCLSLIHI